MSAAKKCVGKESLQRMNYLYQVCNTLATEDKVLHKVALQYSNLLVNISKKAVQRLDVGLKRTICKGCRSLLLPGITCKVRIKKKKVIKHCLICSHCKIFDCKEKRYLPWSQKKESLVEVLDYTPTEKLCKSDKNKDRDQDTL